jgi:outer membrane protein TolC
MGPAGLERNANQAFFAQALQPLRPNQQLRTVLCGNRGSILVVPMANRLQTQGLVSDCRVVLALALLFFGCSRAYYRRSADCETYSILKQKTKDPRWAVPSTSIDPKPTSRLFDPNVPDCPPMPPDDPAAHQYMHCVDGMKGYGRWHDNGDSPSVESSQWRSYLPTSKDGTVLLTPDGAVELGVLNSRDYQQQLEDLYLSALGLTLERFAFDVQWFAINRTVYEHFGTGGVDKPNTPKIEGNETNTLTTSSNVGFSRAFASGGQFVVDFANSFVWQFTGAGTSSTSSNLAIDLVQPLLRHAGREIRLEALTQAERSVLYEARDFARFRKQFYFDVSAGADGFLELLLQVQAIRNFEANLESLEQSLRLHEALAEAGIVSRLQVDQVFQSYQRGRFELTQAQADLEDALDRFKSTLGLPPDVPVKLDDSLLTPFQLNDPAITELERALDDLLAATRVLDEAPPLAQLKDGFEQLGPFQERLTSLLQNVQQEIARWSAQISLSGTKGAPEVSRERAAHKQLAERMAELQADSEALRNVVRDATAAVREDNRAESWEQLQKLARQQTNQVADLFVIQTQVRARLINLQSLEYELDSAVQFAFGNRLDLMNERGRVVDAWRKITVAADGLESDLDVFFSANLGTEPGKNNPIAFSAAANRYQVGFQFDGPLNREAERNIYRASLVNYQRARRAYMNLKDSIARSVRRDLRQLEADRLNFEIARQSLIAAARQVELARDQLLAPGPAGDSSTTQDVLNALTSLLDAKNALIRVWVRYETGRLKLLLDLEAMQLDERGVYTNERDQRIREAEPGEASAIRIGGLVLAPVPKSSPAPSH